jgi:ubiquinone biosynthesis protein COQ9
MSRFTASRQQKVSDCDAVIRAALPHVAFDGWTAKTLNQAAEVVGLADAVPRLFPGGPRDAVIHFMDMADRLMIEDAKAHDLAAMATRERVAFVVRLRLERWTPYREAVRRALALAPLPPFAGATLRGWYRTVDAIWRVAGDRSTDFNFYTKRGLLAAVYAATVLFWLDDRSSECEATWAFLDRRIADVMQIPQIQARFKEGMGLFPNPWRLMKRARAVWSSRRGTGY